MTALSKNELLSSLQVARYELQEQMRGQAATATSIHGKLYAFEGRRAGYVEALDDIQSLLTSGYPNDPLQCWPKS